MTSPEKNEVSEVEIPLGSPVASTDDELFENSDPPVITVDDDGNITSIEW